MMAAMLSPRFSPDWPSPSLAGSPRLRFLWMALWLLGCVLFVLALAIDWRAALLGVAASASTAAATAIREIVRRGDDIRSAPERLGR